eukprot:7009255-Prorocentrum_lima.AAC.1
MHPGHRKQPLGPQDQAQPGQQIQQRGPQSRSANSTTNWPKTWTTPTGCSDPSRDTGPRMNDC